MSATLAVRIYYSDDRHVKRRTYPDPIRRHSDCRPLRSCMQRQDLWHIAPRNTVDRCPINQHIQKEESNCSWSCWVFVGLALKAEQDCHQHHTQAHPNHSPYHGPAASESVCENGGKCTADDKHNLNASANDLWEVLVETDIGVEDGWDVVTKDIYPLVVFSECWLTGAYTTRLIPPIWFINCIP